MGDKVAYLVNGSLESGTRDFVILPRGRKTLKERLINHEFNLDAMPDLVFDEVLMRLGITGDEFAEMTEEERYALRPKVQEILNDLTSGLTLKQVYKLLASDVAPVNDGGATLRTYIMAAYSKSSDSEVLDGSAPFVPEPGGGTV